MLLTVPEWAAYTCIGLVALAALCAAGWLVVLTVALFFEAIARIAAFNWVKRTDEGRIDLIQLIPGSSNLWWDFSLNSEYRKLWIKRGWGISFCSWFLGLSRMSDDEPTIPEAPCP